jgi:replicative DNA helicase
LRESGSLEQDADIVMFIHRQEEGIAGSEMEPSPSGSYRRGPSPKVETVVTEIIVAKHRHGPTGSVKLIFFPSRTRFENAAERPEDQAGPTRERRE